MNNKTTDHAHLLVLKGQELLDGVVDHLMSSLDATVTCIGTLRVVEEERIFVRAAQYRHGTLEIDSYEACHTPCRNVARYGDELVVRSHLQDAFPQDEWFKDLDLESYVGIPLLDENGNPYGLILSEWDAPIEQSQIDSALDLMKTFVPHVSESILALEQQRILQDLARGTSDPSRDGIFEHLAKAFADALMVNTSFIGVNVADEPEKFVVRAYHHNGEMLPEVLGAEIEYISGPCQHVRNEGVYLVKGGLTEMFPNDLFESQGLTSYVGFALSDQEGKVIGHVAGLHDRTLSDRILGSPLLETLCHRINSEISRLRSE